MSWLIEDHYNREQEDVNVVEDADENRAPSVNDIVTIFGKPENCESAKQILIDNIPKTIDVSYYYWKMFKIKHA